MSSLTAQNLITGALRLLGAVDAGETPSTSELADGLVALNDLLDNWQAERLNVYAITQSAFSLITAQAAYTIGPTGADFTAARPIHIDAANITINSPGGTGSQRHALKILNSAEFSAISKQAIKAPVAKCLFNDRAFPKSTLTLWPVPTFSGGSPKLELFTWTPLTSFADQTTAVVFPPAYARAIRFNLALELAPEFMASPSAELVGLAMEAKAAMRAMNGTVDGQTEPQGPVNALTPAAPAKE